MYWAPLFQPIPGIYPTTHIMLLIRFPYGKTWVLVPTVWVYVNACIPSYDSSDVHYTTDLGIMTHTVGSLNCWWFHTCGTADHKVNRELRLINTADSTHVNANNVDYIRSGQYKARSQHSMSPDVTVNMIGLQKLKVHTVPHPQMWAQCKLKSSGSKI